RGPEFVTRKISTALARLARGGTEPCVLGNMDAKRDWGFAGDYVDGMWRMLQQDKAEDYVLATGVVTSVREFVNFVAEALDMSLDWEGQGVTERATDRRSGKLVVTVGSHLFRPAEVAQLVGDASKARKVLGWEPRVSVRQLAEMMVRADYDLLA
ncbi:MAG: GDP-mannose 4,6-dehydratase, partial [Paracoccaceae bacterium]